MIDIWVKLVSDQLELAMNLTRQFLGLGAGEAPVSAPMDPASAAVPHQADAPAAKSMDEPRQETGRKEEGFAAAAPEAEAVTLPEAAQLCCTGTEVMPGRQIESQTDSTQAEAAPIPDIITFLESSTRGATVREIATHLEMDKKNILPLLKTLVKEKRIDELLGRYCMVKTGGS